ncbi:TetR/AcrR family transcriptional regulator [uncultured Eubacterium sp.]|uniref:TetR/AcrR family transcriptional regulator n=1 Tax=uncultured Eubacterium sp. TaxID=165185 RepID=UPI0025E39793|nr:TetR/AcrR family transcriptional regulator [uncultured Eubacterium sp.]
MFEKRYKEAFERASDERKEKILEVGINEFASKGYENANINIIAKNAGISIGLMYKYFSTKEDLFITCIQRGMSILDDAVDEILKSDDKLLTKAEKLIRTTCQLSQKDANYVKLYNEITSERNSEKAMEFAKAIEGETSKKYVKCITDALANGDVRQDMDPRLFAFFLDNLLTSLQFSFTCDYYRNRLEIYTGVDVAELSEDQIVKQLLKFIESAFTFEK